jgi:hypothetical protein
MALTAATFEQAESPGSTSVIVTIVGSLPLIALVLKVRVKVIAPPGATVVGVAALRGLLTGGTPACAPAPVGITRSIEKVSTGQIIRKSDNKSPAISSLVQLWRWPVLLNCIFLRGVSLVLSARFIPFILFPGAVLTLTYDPMPPAAPALPDAW